MQEKSKNEIDGPLGGIRAVELQGFIAGAGCAGLLADLGAEVIKIEPPNGDPYRAIQGSFASVNKGKKFIVADLHKEEGQEILHKLVKTCDVLVHNFRPGSEKKMGADYEAISKINPQIIYYSVSGYGLKGPDRDKPAYDYVSQARSGIAKAQGGPNAPPALVRSAVVDHITAALGAYGIILALLVRKRTGIGQFVNTSLMAGSIVAQSGRLVSYSGKTNGETQMGTLGKNATYRIYQTLDGHIFLGCDDDEIRWLDLCKVLDKDYLAKDTRFQSHDRRQKNMGELADILGETFLGKSTAEWLDLLEGANIPVAAVNKSEDVFNQPQVIHNNLALEIETRDLGKIRVVNVPIKFSETPGGVKDSGLALGEDTDKIMLELGYSESQIEKLRLKRIVL